MCWAFGGGYMIEVRVWIMVTNRGGAIKNFPLFTFTYVRGG